MTLIDGDRIITAQLYDDEYEEFTEKKMSIIDYINAYTDEGVTETDVIRQTRWIPISERLPEDLEPVNITWVNHNPESYYADIKDKPFTATGVYFNGQWYWYSSLCTDLLAEYSHNYDDIIDDDIEVIAWMPLPEPYKAEAESEDKE